MTRSVAVSAILGLLISSVTSFAQPGAPQKDVQDLEKRVLQLEKLLDLQKGQLKRLDAVETKADTNNNLIGGLHETDQNLFTRIRELNAAIEDIAQRRGDRWYPKILGKMQADREFFREMIGSTQGKLIIHNYTGRPQMLIINGGQQWLAAGSSVVWVPVGRVVAHTPYQQPLVLAADRWQVGKEGFEQTLSIRE